MPTKWNAQAMQAADLLATAADSLQQEILLEKGKGEAEQRTLDRLRQIHDRLTRLLEETAAG